MKTTDGSQHVYHYAEDGVIESGRATGQGAVAAGKATSAGTQVAVTKTAQGVTEGSKVTVHYTETAGRKIGHAFKTAF